MTRSLPLTDAGGALVAVAAQGDVAGPRAGWFLVALDPRLEELDRANFRDPEAARRAVAAALARVSLAA